MLKLSILTLLAALGVSRVALAAMPVMPVATPDSAIVQVAEGCGPGGWRSGLDNRCRPLGPYAHGYAMTACPAGWHIGPRLGACWPNRAA